MSLLRTVTDMSVSEIRKTSDMDLRIPSGLSFFDPYLRYFVNEVLDAGGEAHVAKASDGTVSGIFIYDGFEKTGAIYTRSRDAFDYFYGLRPFNLLFAEMSSQHESEIYDIYTIDLEALGNHRFRHEISMAGQEHADEVRRFMASAHQGMNMRWVDVALRNGDRCATVRSGSEIAGLGWLSLVSGIGRLHSLYVKPQFRGMGIGEDILYARLLWLRSKHARSAFSEIARDNLPSTRVATKGHMSASGQIFQYFRPPRPARIAHPRFA